MGYPKFVIRDILRFTRNLKNGVEEFIKEGSVNEDTTVKELLEIVDNNIDKLEKEKKS